MYAAHAYNIRKSTAADEPALHRLAELDSQRPLTGDALVAEIDAKPAAAISLADGRVIADPFQQTAVATQVLHMRYGALRAYSRTPSLPDRMRDALAPFRARTRNA
jgi:hypothetical protein